MKQVQYLKCSPAYYSYVVHLATRNKDNNFLKDSQTLTVVEQQE